MQLCLNHELPITSIQIKIKKQIVPVSALIVLRRKLPDNEAPFSAFRGHIILITEEVNS